MKQLIKKSAFVLLAAALVAPASLLAQKDKEEKKETEHIIITRKGDANGKMVIEVDGDKITVNGKPVDEKDGDITVQRSKENHVWAYADGLGAGAWKDNFAFFNGDDDRAILGVTTQKNDQGAEIKTVTKDGGAEKAGLKPGDVIKKVGDAKVEDPDDLSSAIKKHKPGDKVTITYLRAGKEQTVSAELTKWAGYKIFGNGQQNYNMTIPIPDVNVRIPSIEGYPRVYGQGWAAGGAPRLGVSVQDTDDGKGAKVIEIDDEGNAYKAGIKEDDIITEVDGKAVNSADEVAKAIKENKDKPSVNIKVLREGKTQTINVKVPRKLKTANL